MHNVWFVASAWMGIAFLASLISIRLGVSVALIEILLGVVAGNTFHIQSNEWISFLATFGAGLLTFLAGAEIDPESLRSHLKQSMAIGVIAFLIPFLGVLAFAYWFGGWSYHQALIAGIALSTTSVAVVYAVLVENGLSQTELGKMILAACFINDFGTVLALGVFFANFNRWMVLFVVVMAVMLYFLPSWTRGIIKSLGETRVSEPEVKFLFLVLFFLGGLATMAKSEAVLPAYLAGLVVAGVFLNDRVLVTRMRSIAFTMLTPFYFIKAGLYVSLPALVPTAGIVVILLLIKMFTKFIGVWPLGMAFGIPMRERNYTTMLMSTGLTFGTISALFGLENKIISQAQYTVLVTVVILSAVVPTLIAERFFMPDTGVEAARERHASQPVRAANE
ncbi:MAG: cation:proton antiporter [Candidatus Binatus sp.]|uniref:cation:proton antiporter n=1 Tax=Candidatus Binatus sp. TaxID=2811406 RepID=UPI003C73710F